MKNKSTWTAILPFAAIIALLLFYPYEGNKLAVFVGAEAPLIAIAVIAALWLFQNNRVTELTLDEIIKIEVKPSLFGEPFTITDREEIDQIVALLNGLKSTTPPRKTVRIPTQEYHLELSSATMLVWVADLDYKSLRVNKQGEGGRYYEADYQRLYELLDGFAGILEEVEETAMEE